MSEGVFRAEGDKETESHSRVQTPQETRRDTWGEGRDERERMEAPPAVASGASVLHCVDTAGPPLQTCPDLSRHGLLHRTFQPCSPKHSLFRKTSKQISSQF